MYQVRILVIWNKSAGQNWGCNLNYDLGFMNYEFVNHKS